MGRFLAGSIAALLLVAAGLFWWQGEADKGARPLIARGGAKAQALSLPGEGDADARGAAPPSVPEAAPRTREQKRFDRYDRNRDGVITRPEMMSSRSASFEEWAVRTSDRFATADADRNGKLSPEEFAATAPKPAQRKPVCACDD